MGHGSPSSRSGLSVGLAPPSGRWPISRSTGCAGLQAGTAPNGDDLAVWGTLEVAKARTRETLLVVDHRDTGGADDLAIGVEHTRDLARTLHRRPHLIPSPIGIGSPWLRSGVGARAQRPRSSVVRMDRELAPISDPGPCPSAVPTGGGTASNPVQEAVETSSRSNAWARRRGGEIRAPR